MGTVITLGEYNKLYKYIWISISLKIVFQYLFGTDFPEEIKIFKKTSFPKNVLIQEGLNYLGIFIFSIFLFIYEKTQNKSETDKSIASNNNDNNSSFYKIYSKYLIYKDFENIQYSLKPVIILVLLIIFSDQLRNTFYTLNLKGLDFKMFELLFVCVITLLMFKIPIYRHKKVAIGFIIFLCISMKALSIKYRLIDNHKRRIFKIYSWIIPVGIFSFILISLLRSYNFCKAKWLFDLKFISVSKLLLFYGALGSIICLTVSIFPSLFHCRNKQSFYNIDFICNVTDFDLSNNSTSYYYESYSLYLKNLWREERAIYKNFIYLILILIEIILYFLIKLYSVLIIKNLYPEYLICSNLIYYFIIETIDSISCIFLNKFKYYKLYDILDELFSIIGTIFYLELIEFNFWGLDFDLKKNIKKRSESESRLGSSIGEESSNASEY